MCLLVFRVCVRRGSDIGGIILKYLTWELLDSAQNGDNPKVDKDWGNNCDKYYAEYSKIKKNLPKKLVQQYEADGFHDSIITTISITSDGFQRKPTRNISVELCKMWGATVYYRGILLYQDVSIFCADMSHIKNNTAIGEYLYGEFYFDKQERFTHNFIFTDRNEILIKCRKIVWNEIEKNSIN